MGQVSDFTYHSRIAACDWHVSFLPFSKEAFPSHSCGPCGTLSASFADPPSRRLASTRSQALLLLCWSRTGYHSLSDDWCPGDVEQERWIRCSLYWQVSQPSPDYKWDTTCEQRVNWKWAFLLTSWGNLRWAPNYGSHQWFSSAQPSYHHLPPSWPFPFPFLCPSWEASCCFFVFQKNGDNSYKELWSGKPDLKL